MTGKPLFDKVLAALNLVCVLGAVGLVAYSHTSIKPVPTDQAAEEEKLKSEAALGSQITPIKLKKLIANLYTRESRLRFLSLDMDLLPFKEEQKEALKKNEAILRDITITLVGSMTAEELNSLSGKILLENRIKNQFNQKTGDIMIRKIYFSNFVIQ